MRIWREAHGVLPLVPGFLDDRGERLTRPVGAREIWRRGEDEVDVDLRDGGVGAQTPAMGAVHRHEDCGPRERLWLPKERGAEASAARHPYCVACGTVKSLALPRAKPLGYYLSGLAGLKRYLEAADRGPKLAQVQSHLIATRLSGRPEFADPYGTPGPAQIQAYVDVVRSVRPDVDREVMLRLLPGSRRRGGSKDNTSGWVA